LPGTPLTTAIVPASVGVPVHCAFA
jgi:hypothetical protein